MDLLSRLPAELWYLILQHLRQNEVLALAATCQASADVFRNPPAPLWRMLHAGKHFSWWRLATYVEQRQAGVIALCVKLRLDGDGEGYCKTVRSIEDHHCVLHFGLPRLLAACPALELHLRIAGGNPFAECTFQLPQDHHERTGSVRHLHTSSLDSLHRCFSALQSLDLDPYEMRDNISPMQFEVPMLCQLTRLRRLTVRAAPADDEDHSIDSSEADCAGLAEIPAAISQLQMLHSLRLLGHEALGSLPAELFTLTRLTLLDISNSAILVLPEALGQLTALREFHKNEDVAPGKDGALTVGAALQPLQRLAYLSLKRQTLRLRPSSELLLPPSLLHSKLFGALCGCQPVQLQLRPLPALTYLDFGCQKAHGRASAILSEALTTMTSLQVLRLDRNGLRGLGSAGSSLVWLRQLTELDLSRNRLTAVPTVLAAATSLQQLYMHQQSCAGRNFSWSAFDAGSLAILRGITTLRLLGLEHYTGKSVDGYREWLQPSEEMLAATGDLQQHNPTLKVDI